MILVTGATGFVGHALCNSMAPTRTLRAAAREPSAVRLPQGVEVVRLDLLSDDDWSPILADVRTVVHCAARVHVMKDRSADPLAAFRRTNVEGTLRLARAAVKAGAKRFVYLSSIKVNGEQTVPGKPFTADQTPQPADDYGVSKMEAEAGLRSLAAETGMELVIVRPPLAYGPGVKANFLSMMGWLKRGVPLPFGAVTGNRRSMVALENLVDLVGACVDRPAAANQTFLVSDGEDLSTAALLTRMGEALGRPARLISVPLPLLTAIAALLGRRDLSQRLCGSLQVDMTKTTQLLGWIPPISVSEGLRRTAASWLEAN